MGIEIDLLCNYPKTKRNIQDRGNLKTEADRAIARRFDKEFFDGDRAHGYGGFSYQKKFWTPVIPDFQKHFNIHVGNSVLDVGCAKGFMLHDMMELIPGINIRGIDISEYAIANALPSVKPYVEVANAISLPFADKTFDVVISINTVHNLDREHCGKALQEIERVSRGASFITVDAYRNEEERLRMEAWNLTAQTIMHVDEWVSFFKDVGYTGDYYWFIP